MSLPSYERKFARAERHFHEVERVVATYAHHRPYLVTHRIEGKSNTHVYRLTIPRQPPARLPLIVGDLVHNLRSALDHVASSVSKDPRASFPLSEFDIWPVDPTTVVDQERLKRERAQWNRLVEGLEYDAVAMFKKHIPSQNRPATTEDFNGLGALAFLSNADKHRELIVLKGVVDEPVFNVIDEFGFISRWPNPGVFFENDAVIFSHKREVQVEVDGPGGVLVGVRGGKEVGLVHYLQIMLDHIRDKVIPDFVPYIDRDS
jgi:hypothetical protein